jgi:hypothetical protein
MNGEVAHKKPSSCTKIIELKDTDTLLYRITSKCEWEKWGKSMHIYRRRER